MSTTPEQPVTAVISLVINGAEHSVTVDTRTSLLDLLREQLGLIGAKKGCDHGQCGACTVLLDGRRANSCARRDSLEIPRTCSPGRYAIDIR